MCEIVHRNMKDLQCEKGHLNSSKSSKVFKAVVVENTANLGWWLGPRSLGSAFGRWPQLKKQMERWSDRKRRRPLNDPRDTNLPDQIHPIIHQKLPKQPKINCIMPHLF